MATTFSNVTTSSNMSDFHVSFLSNETELSSYVLSTPAFYWTPKHQVFNFVADGVLSFLTPVVVYWVYSIFFHVLDSIDTPWVNRHRIHDSAEVKSRNLVSRTSCLLWVAFQQVIQTILGWFWMEEEKHIPGFLTDVGGIRNAVVAAAKLVLGEPTAARFLRTYGADAVWIVYWYGIPLAQLTLAMFCIDTWQYFWHRAFHVNKWLYRNFHSWHHRLYVPYAYGALYNHPLEGFVLDTLGAALAESITFMSVRQATVLFAFSTMKTIDDHCGYRLPLDPLQLLFGNNADYHDIHHQVAGIKSNFSQPFFIHWDTILGTRMTREALEARQKKGKSQLNKDL